MNNPYAYLFGGSAFPTSVPMNLESSFSFAGPSDEMQPNYMPHYIQQEMPRYQLPNLVPMPYFEPQIDNSVMLNQQINIPTIMDDDELFRDLFSFDDRPPAIMPAVSAPLTPEATHSSETFCGVVLPQNLVDQIMTADTAQDSGNVLEMLRNNIRTSMEAHVPSNTVPADTRPPLHTESIHHDKKEKKGGVKKRRYVKSGLYRKDKNGNFIYSSSDRARLAQTGEETKGSDTATQTYESADSSSQSTGTRVKRPLNAYNIFCKLHFEQVKTENPELSINELSKLMGEKWKAMSTNQKKTYYDKVEHGQTRFKKPLNSYNLFCKKNFDALKKEFPHKSIHVLSKVIAERWKKLSESEKKVYYDEAERQKQYGQQQQQQIQEEEAQGKDVEVGNSSLSAASVDAGVDPYGHQQLTSYDGLMGFDFL